MKKLISTMTAKIKASKTTVKKSAKVIHERDQFHELIRLERERVLRNERQFSLIIIRIDENDRIKSSTIEMVANVSKRIRKTDHLGWYDDTHLGILMPNTDKIGAQVFTNDIRKWQSDSEANVDFETQFYPNKE